MTLVFQRSARATERIAFSARLLAYKPILVRAGAYNYAYSVAPLPGDSRPVCGVPKA
jgi:hypothetical protein